VLDPRGLFHDAGPLPILIDTDFATNVDDLLAVLFAVGSEKLELAAVTTVHGLPDVRARAARRVLDFVGAFSVPVGAGRAPVQGELFVSGYESTYALPGTDPDHFPSASEVFREVSGQHGDNLVVVAIGPLTNVASWLSEPLEHRPRCVVAMAGCFRKGGTDRNVQSDAVAARRLVEAGIPVIFVGIEICRQVTYDTNDLYEIQKGGNGSELCELLEVQSKNWWNFKGAGFSNPCDPLTLLAFTSPSLFEFQRTDVSFVVGGELNGQTVWSDHDSGQFLRATAVDSERARCAIVSTINRVVRTTGPHS